MTDGGLRARVRTKDGWAVQHAALTVTDMTGTQIVRTAADESGVVQTAPLKTQSATKATSHGLLQYGNRQAAKSKAYYSRFKQP